MQDIQKLSEYDSEPVKYCTRCLSLKIKYEDVVEYGECVGTECCGDCGCTDITEAPVEEWEKKYKAKYGHKLVEGKKDIRKHPIFQLTIGQLKQKLYDNPEYKELIRYIYPHFPDGFSRIDSILLFFDRLIRENKVDDFRILLLSKIKKNN